MPAGTVVDEVEGWASDAMGSSGRRGELIDRKYGQYKSLRVICVFDGIRGFTDLIGFYSF